MAPGSLSTAARRAVGDTIGPPTCVLCGADGPGLCHPCACALRSPPRAPVPGALDGLVVLCAYDRHGRDLVLALKRRNRREVLPLLGGALGDAVLGAGPDPATRPVDLVTWAPTTVRRRAKRGFDQSQQLARHVALHLGVPCRALLRRASGHLAGASRPQRLAGVRFEGSRRSRGGHGRILLVDDVVTTGSTMCAAAATLRAQGADSVIGAAIARARPGAVAGASVGAAQP